MHIHDYIFSGISLHSDSLCFVLDELDSHKREFFCPLGKNITITKQEARYCSGIHGSTPCPTWYQLFWKETICPSCKKHIWYNPFFDTLSSEKLSKKQQKYNEKEHVVYLAYFWNSTVKVGISSANRLKKRLLEQWARSAVVALECKNAYEARDAEKNIRISLDIPEIIRSKKKQLLAQQSYNTKNAQKHLKEAWKKVNELYQHTTPFSYIDFTDIYIIESFSKTPINISENATISGKVFGIIGSIMLLENSNEILLFDTKKLLNYHIQLTEGSIIEPLDITIQKSLF